MQNQFTQQVLGFITTKEISNVALASTNGNLTGIDRYVTVTFTDNSTPVNIKLADYLELPTNLETQIARFNEISTQTVQKKSKVLSDLSSFNVSSL